MDQLEHDVIGGSLGIYLLVDNDGRGGGCWYFVSGSMKPDSEDNGNGEKKSARCQCAGKDDSVVSLHEGSC